MSTITISSFVVPNWQLGGASCTLRILSNQTFRTSEGEQINVSTQDVFYQTVACTISGTDITVPQFTIDSTTDSSDPNATYNALIYVSNAKKQLLFAAWQVPHNLGTPLAYSALHAFNESIRSPRVYSYPNIEQVDALIDAIAQPLDADLTRIAELTPTDDDFIQRKAGRWTNRTPAQVKTDLTYTLDNLTDVATTGASTGEILQYNGSSWEPASGTNYALKFDETYHQHVNHGVFWNPETPVFGMFFWEAWINHSDGAEYIISDDYSGAHNLLWGLTGNADYNNITGNVFINGGTVSFSSMDSIYTGDWHHVAVGWDGFWIYTWIDGVYSKKVAASGLRSTSGSAVAGILFVGGSDHSNYNGYIRNIRGFEGWFPYTSSVAGNGAITYRPEHNFKNIYRDTLVSSLTVGASFLTDYSSPANNPADLSDGFSNGIRQVETNTVVAAAGITGDGNARAIVTANGMIGSPKTVTVAVTTALTTATLIATAFRTALKIDANVNRFFIVGGSGADITLTAIEPQANDSTMNFTIEDVTSTGITDSLTSTNTTAGYQGKLIRHPGYLASELDGSNTGTIDGGNPPSGRTANLPTFEAVTFAAPAAFQGTTLSIPVGAVVYDDFSRPNVTWAWTDTLTPGTARTGHAVTCPNSDVGIIDGCAFGAATIVGPPNTTVGSCTYNVGSANQEVTITRKSGSSGGEKVIARYTDANNYIVAEVDVTIDSVLIYEVVAGTPASIGGGASVGISGWSSMTLGVSGTAVTLTFPGAPPVVFNGTTTLLTGNRAGFAVAGLGRVNTFQVS
jgi:hypothetical protein